MDQHNNNSGAPVAPASPQGEQQSGSAPQPIVPTADQAPAPQPVVSPQAPAPIQSEPVTPNPLATPPVVPIGAKPDAFAPGATAGIPQSAPSSITPPPQTPTPLPSPAQHKGKPMLWVIILLVFAFLCGLMLAVWYFQTQIQNMSPVEQTTQLPVAVQEKIVIGTDATSQPMEYTATGGALMGFDIDLGNRVGEELKTTVEFKNISRENLFQALDAKQIDMIISSVVITDALKQKYDFSDSYLSQASTSAATNKSYSIVFRKGDPNLGKVNEILTVLQTQGVLTNLKQKWLE